MDLLKYGLIPEFVGRLPVVATLEDLDELKQYQRLFEMESIDLTLAEEALSAIARKAIDRKTGARGLRSIMEGILLDTMFDLPSLERVQEVVISKDAVEGTAARLARANLFRSMIRTATIVGPSKEEPGEAFIHMALRST